MEKCALKEMCTNGNVKQKKCEAKEMCKYVAYLIKIECVITAYKFSICKTRMNALFFKKFQQVNCDGSVQIDVV